MSYPLEQIFALTLAIVHLLSSSAFEQPLSFVLSLMALKMIFAIRNLRHIHPPGRHVREGLPGRGAGGGRTTAPYLRYVESPHFVRLYCDNFRAKINFAFDLFWSWNVPNGQYTVYARRLLIPSFRNTRQIVKFGCLVVVIPSFCNF